MKASECDS